MRMLFAVVLALMLGGAAADARVSIVIDKSAQRMTVSADGRQLYNWPVSTGRAGRDTPGGEFRAFRMEKDHYSKEWDDAPMPNSIFFTRIGHAIHGTYDVKKIGSPASAGCVRLDPENAEVLFALVEERAQYDREGDGGPERGARAHPASAGGCPRRRRRRRGHAALR